MTYEEMDNLFETLIDKPYTGYLGTDVRNQIFNQAQVNIVERKYGEYQVNRKIPDELLGLVVTDSSSYSGLNATTATLPSDYRHYMTSEIVYEVEDEEIRVTPYAPTEDMRYVRDPYDSPKIVEPQIRISDQIYIEPSDTNVKDLIFVYLKEPDTINILDNTTEPVYNYKMQHLVVEEAANIALRILRDQFGYQSTQQEIIENP